jgi:hypothetical protein
VFPEHEPNEIAVVAEGQQHNVDSVNGVLVEQLNEGLSQEAVAVILMLFEPQIQPQGIVACQTPNVKRLPTPPHVI